MNKEEIKSKLEEIVTIHNKSESKDDYYFGLNKCRTIANSILSSLTKTIINEEEIKNILYVDFPLVEDYSERIDNITNSIMELIEGLSVPQPLKPLSDIKTAKQIIDAKIHNVENGIYSCYDQVYEVADEIISAMEEYKNQFTSLPVDNTVSETEQKLQIEIEYSRKLTRDKKEYLSGYFRRVSETN